MRMPPLTQAVVHEARIQFCANSYQPIDVLNWDTPNAKSPGKAPFRTDWPNVQGVPPFNGKARNTGLLTGTSRHALRPADIDIEDAAFASLVRAAVELHLGPSPVWRGRGNSPRIMGFYRTADGKPQPKRTVEFRQMPRPSPTTYQKIEILGHGQQVLVPPSLHPSGTPYDWAGGRGLDEIPYEDLPPVSEAQIKALFATLTSPEFGGVMVVGQDNNDGRIPNGAGSEVPPATEQDVVDAESALLSLPCDYATNDTFVRIALAAFRAGVRFEVMAQWCAIDAHHRFEPDGKGEKWLSGQWRSFANNPRNGGITAATLFDEVYTRRPGWTKPSRGGTPEQNDILPTLPSPLEGGNRRPKDKGNKGGGGRGEKWFNGDDGRFAPTPGEPKESNLPRAEEAWNPWHELPVPLFPLGTLPPLLQRWIEERASATGADPSGFAMAIIAAVSGAIDHRVKVKAKQNDDYFISVSLWALLVGMPSVRKSVPIDAVEYWLLASDHRDQVAYAAAKAEAEKRGDDPKAIPKPRSRVLNDSTSEGLCVMLSEQDCGCILVRDELSGWIGAMDKYGGGGKGAAQDRSVWVKAHGGGPFVQRRAGLVRSVNNLSSSILGAIQPDRLAEMGRLDSDGLLQRFQIVMMRNARPSQDKPRDPAITRDIAAMFRVFETFAPMVIPMGAEARAIYKRLDEDMTMALSMTDPSPAFGAFCGKQPRTFATLCLILHCIGLATGPVTATEEISEATAIAADRIVRDFLIPHGHLFYSLLAGSLEVTHQRAIAAAICRHTKPIIRTRDLMRSVHHLNKLKAIDVQEALFPFVGGGWLVPVERGHDNSQWVVTPGLAQRFAREVEAQIALTVAIKQIILQERGRPEEPA